MLITLLFISYRYTGMKYQAVTFKLPKIIFRFYGTKLNIFSP